MSILIPDSDFINFIYQDPNEKQPKCPSAGDQINNRVLLTNKKK